MFHLFFDTRQSAVREVIDKDDSASCFEVAIVRAR